MGIGRWSSAGWSRDTIGYNPRSKIIKGGSWTRVELYREHGRTVLLAACSGAFLPVHLQAPTPIPETLVPRLEGHGIVSEVFVWRPQDAALVDIVFPHRSEDVGTALKPFSR
jgi:hypothetical protein